MSKKFWLFIITFWFLCILAGTITYSMLVYSQKQERKLFVAQYRYEDATERVQIQTQPLKSYSKETFLKDVEVFTQTLNQLENSLKHYMNVGDREEALKVALEGYQKTKTYIKQYGNNEFTGVTTMERYYFDNMAYHLHFYAKYASLYFIVSAKKINASNTTIEAQQKAAIDSLTSAKEAFTKVYTKYKSEY